MAFAEPAVAKSGVKQVNFQLPNEDVKAKQDDDDDDSEEDSSDDDESSSSEDSGDEEVLFSCILLAQFAVEFNLIRLRDMLNL